MGKRKRRCVGAAAIGMLAGMAAGQEGKFLDLVVTTDDGFQISDIRCERGFWGCYSPAVTSTSGSALRKVWTSSWVRFVPQA